MALYHGYVVVLSALLLFYLALTTESSATTHPYASFVHLAATGAWFGISLWVTFVAGVLLYKYLPRHLFGETQSKIFPWYFGMSFVLVLTALASWAHLEDNDTFTLADPSVAVLAGAAALLALQFLVLGPLVTEAMRERNRREKEEGFADVAPSAAVPGKERSTELRALSKRFARLHGLSSAANLLVFLAAVYQLYKLAAQHVRFEGFVGGRGGGGGGVKAFLKQ